MLGLRSSSFSDVGPPRRLGGYPNQRGNSRRWLTRELEASLHREGNWIWAMGAALVAKANN
jgi:hypothetical protein